MILALIFLVLTIAFIASRRMKVKELVILLVLHVGLSLTAYIKYVDYKEVRNEYVAYAYEQYAFDRFFNRVGQPDSWPYRIDPEAEEMEDKQDNLWLLVMITALLDLSILFFIGTTYESRLNT